MTKETLFFDAETCPVPDDELIQPVFKSPANYRDPEKIAAYIEECKQEWRSGLALSPMTGRILTIGLLDSQGFRALEGTEKEILGQFWRRVETVLIGDGNLVGFNCNQFDLVFAYKRSWRNGMKPSPLLRAGRYWSKSVIDVRDLWQLGDRQVTGTLDQISRFLGGPGKTGSGKDFAELWATDKPAALAYLERDIRETERLFRVMSE